MMETFIKSFAKITEMTVVFFSEPEGSGLVRASQSPLPCGHGSERIGFCKGFIEVFGFGFRVSLQRVLVAALFLSATSARAQTPSQKTLSQLPFASQKSVPIWLASTAPTRNNQDYYLLKPRETRRIALPQGELLRLWFTRSDPEKCDVTLQNGAQKTMLLQNGRARLGELFAKAWTFYPSLLSFNTSSTRSAWKMVAGANLVVSNRTDAEMKFYLQAATDASAKNAVASVGKTSQVVSEWTLQPQTSRDFAINGGNGIVEQIDITFDGEDLRGGKTLSDGEVLNGVKLQATWDDDKNFAVDASLSQLAGGWRDAIVPNSAVAKTGKNKFSLRWPMPLPSRRKLSLRNETSQPINFYISTTIRQTAVPTSRFHARVGGETTVVGKPIQLLKVRGKGALVGLNLDMRPQPNATRQTFVFLEGNEIIKTDDRVLEGTGTEDFFNSAWYYPDKTFARDFHGLARKTLRPPGITTYRWLVPDAISFQKTLDFQMGHSGRNKTNNMEYRWVAFWYQNVGGTFEIENAVSPVVMSSSQTEPEATLLQRVIKFLPVAFLIVGTFLWLRMSWRRKQN